jgi:hypothetical protein
MPTLLTTLTLYILLFASPLAFAQGEISGTAGFNSEQEQLVCEKYRVIDAELSAADPGNPGSGCGTNGYLLKFGYRYCSLFVKKNYFYTPLGQTILRSIRHCLVQALEDSEIPLQCGNVRKIGFESHFGCYLQAGFCDMPLHDKMILMFQLRQQILNPEAERVFTRLLQACD